MRFRYGMRSICRSCQCDAADEVSTIAGLSTDDRRQAVRCSMSTLHLRYRRSCDKYQCV